jgi:hypothetical protein
MSKHLFRGPLFIVGMSRSGTKLLRDLLNQHPRIALPFEESHFIPHFVSRFGNPPSFSHPKELYRALSKTTFFWNMQQQGIILPEDVFSDSVDIDSWASIFQFILKFYARQEESANFIWGDKTPSYLEHIDLLHDLYPQARFLHIIRDPRDRSLSVNKTWGKHIYRAADEWRHKLQVARATGQSLKESYKEVHYEDLLSMPEKTLRDICGFLECEFFVRILTLNKSSEYLGDARGQTKIIYDNQRKYLEQLSPAAIQRIEEIVYPVAKNVGYELTFANEFKPMGALQIELSRIYDVGVALRFHIGEKGLLQGIRYFCQTRRHSRIS